MYEQKNRSMPRRILRSALVARFAEEKLLELFSEGKLSGTVHTCVGQELIGAIVAGQMRGSDYAVSNHRCHGHFLSITNNIAGFFGEIFGKKTGACAGVGGSQHLHSGNFYSNGIQGGILPLAAGLAMKAKHSSVDDLAVVFIGDGTFGEGVLYETFNIISRWNLPLLIVVEDNGYAQSTEQSQTLAGSFEGRAAAFSIKYSHKNTWEWDQLEKGVEEAFSHVRTQRSPFLIHVRTFRLNPHSKGDDMRDPTMLSRYWEMDPISQILKSPTFDQAQLIEQVKVEIELHISEALLEEEANVVPLTSECSDEFESEINPPLVISDLRYIERINEALRNLLSDYSDDLMLIGEDIQSPYGGAFKATKGLSDEYPERVLNTPISEAAIVGIGGGYALTQSPIIVEVMFGDFITLAFDQLINHLSKYSQMYNTGLNLPIVVRTPMGGGRGYGPTHSQCLEKHLIGIPNLTVVATNLFVDPACIFEELLEGVSPAVVIENKLQYSQRASRVLPSGFSLRGVGRGISDIYIEPNTSQKTDCTFITYGGISSEVIKAMDILFYEDEILCECIILTIISPLNMKQHFSKLSRSNKIIMVEEGQKAGGVGSEVLAQLCESNETKASLSGVKRIAAVEFCIPSARKQERICIPNAERIVEEARTHLLGNGLFTGV